MLFIPDQTHHKQGETEREKFGRQGPNQTNLYQTESDQTFQNGMTQHSGLASNQNTYFGYVKSGVFGLVLK